MGREEKKQPGSELLSRDGWKKKKMGGVHVPVFLPVLGRGRWIRGCDRTSRWCRCDRTLGIELNRAEGSMGEDKAVQGAKDD